MKNAAVTKTARFRVWKYIHAHPGCTDVEIRKALKMNHNTARPRRIELEHAGLVHLVLPMREDALGNVSERWAANSLPYPDYWPSLKTVDGSALALRAMRRLLVWAGTRPNTSLLVYAQALDAEVKSEIRLRGMKSSNK